jgi:hypothetical protein
MPARVARHPGKRSHVAIRALPKLILPANEILYWQITVRWDGKTMGALVVPGPRARRPPAGTPGGELDGAETLPVGSSLIGSRKKYTRMIEYECRRGAIHARIHQVVVLLRLR